MAVLLKIPFSVRIKTGYLLRVKRHLPNRLLSCSPAHSRIPATDTQLGLANVILRLFHKPSRLPLTAFQKESAKALFRQILPPQHSPQDEPLGDRQLLTAAPAASRLKPPLPITSPRTRTPSREPSCSS